MLFNIIQLINKIMMFLYKLNNKITESYFINYKLFIKLVNSIMKRKPIFIFELII